MAHVSYNLKYTLIRTPDDILKHLEMALKMKKILNYTLEENRSHTIFTVSLTTRELVDDHEFQLTSNVHFVELSGAELNESRGKDQSMQVIETIVKEYPKLPEYHHRYVSFIIQKIELKKKDNFKIRLSLC